MEDKLLSLTHIFAIDVCAYAVMNNHTHVVLHIDENKANSWTVKETLMRWHQLFKGTLLTQQYISDATLSESELLVIKDISSIYRKRLANLSWFMRVLNENIAREANKEDKCTGRFWEGRFKSQALLDEAALIACMAYVDLNPVRAKIADTPENSDYTSIKQRVQQALEFTQPIELMPFVGSLREPMPNGLAFELTDYIDLVDLTGRCIREDKRGFISGDIPNILERLGISEDNWLIMSKSFTKVFHGAVGSETVLTNFADHQGHKRRHNMMVSHLFA